MRVMFMTLRYFETWNHLPGISYIAMIIEASKASLWKALYVL
jgi:hypothetical protein